MKVIWSTLLLFVLTACGASSSINNNVKSFSGQIIEGLNYKTNSKSAKTDESGAFSCNNNEEISFYAGTILLSTVKCKDNLTLFDLANTEAPMNISDYKKSVANKSMSKLMNLASFLQTIDEDGDAGNGIVIPENFATISKDIKLDFADDYYNFKNAFNFRKLMYLGRNNGIWEAERTRVKAHVALDKLYEVMHLIPNVYAVSFRQYKYTYNDSNESGYTFDEYGNFILSKMDENTTTIYNALGQKISLEIDTNDARKLNQKTLYFYDKYGNKILEEEHGHSDIEMQFDSNGNLFTSDRRSNSELVIFKKTKQSYNLDGNLKKSQKYDTFYKVFEDINLTYSYDKYGSEISKEKSVITKFTLDKNDKYCSYYKYNDFGEKTLSELDDNCDGIIDRRTTFTYDLYNRHVSTLGDFDANGIIDRNDTVLYDNNGSKTFLYFSYNENANVDMNISNVFDENDNLLTSDFQSTFMTEYHKIYEYSKTGKILFEKNHDSDGKLIYLSRYEYDVHDNLLLSETKDIIKNEITYKSVYSYDENNNVLTSSIKGNADYDDDEVYTYDNHGNILNYSKVLKQGKNVGRTDVRSIYVNTSKWVSLDFGEKRPYNINF